MQTATYDWERIDALERGLVASFSNHLLFSQLTTATRTTLLKVLLQRRFVSMAFSPIYDLAIDCLNDAESRDCARDILRAEYTHSGQSTHREDLVTDLLALGATRGQIVSSTPSAATQRCLYEMFDVLRCGQEESEIALLEIRALALLRMAGEILVAAEYSSLWPHLRRFGLAGPYDSTGVRSVFYYPHLCHDTSTARLSEPQGPFSAGTHSDRFTARMRALLSQSSARAVQSCVDVNNKAYEIKRAFYDQFVE